jgi:hypothetical protein
MSRRDALIGLWRSRRCLGTALAAHRRRLPSSDRALLQSISRWRRSGKSLNHLDLQARSPPSSADKCSELTRSASQHDPLLMVSSRGNQHHVGKWAAIRPCSHCMINTTGICTELVPNAQVRLIRSLKAQMNRPLLVIDGDSFAHRSYHALPKTIRRPGGGDP